MRIELLSGDRPAVVGPTADEAGIRHWTAACTPAGKAARLAELRAAGRRTLMVGDGLNDAPALAAGRRVGLACNGCGREPDRRRHRFPGRSAGARGEILDVARRAGRLVRQNLALAVFYNIGAVPLAMAGKVTPLIAAIAMSSSSLLVIGNALRLSRRRESRR